MTKNRNARCLSDVKKEKKRLYIYKRIAFFIYFALFITNEQLFF